VNWYLPINAPKQAGGLEHHWLNASLPSGGVTVTWFIIIYNNINYIDVNLFTWIPV